MKREGFSPLRVIGGLAALMACLYFAIQFYAIAHRTYRTEIAIPYEMTANVTLDGVAVFGETPVEGSGNIGYLIEDGERVAGGTKVAEVYSSSRQAELREELTRLDARIALLQKAQNISAGSEISVISTQAENNLYALLDVLDAKNLAGLQADGDAYLLSANRLQVYTGAQSDYSAQIEGLQARRSAVEQELGQTGEITAPASGYFISSGSAGSLTASREELDEMTPAQMQNFLAGTPERRGTGRAGKIITSYQWYYYAVCDAATAELFENYGKVGISFPGKAEDVLPATVELVEIDTEQQLAKVVLLCEYTNAQVLKICHRRARIDFENYSGLRINRQALHILNGEKGVYIKYGTIARWRAIDPIYENDEYILVPATPTETSKVKIYDEIIVEGTELRDGNLL